MRELPFEEIVGLIDERRESGSPLTLIFDPAAPVTNLYAVEMPAMECLTAIAASEGGTEGWNAQDADASAALHEAMVRYTARNADTSQATGKGDAGGVLWRETETKAFIGDAGSMTCAHVDIAPQLELSHCLQGVKFVGVSSHDATERLLDEHAANDEDTIATSVSSCPTKCPTKPRLPSPHPSVVPAY